MSEDTYSTTSELDLKAVHESSFVDVPDGAPGQPLPSVLVISWNFFSKESKRSFWNGEPPLILDIPWLFATRHRTKLYSHFQWESVQSLQEVKVDMRIDMDDIS